MGGFIDFMNRYVIPPLAKIGEEKHLRGIRNGIMLTVPFTIAGSIFLIISSLPLPNWDKIMENYNAMLSVPINVTFGVLSVIAAIGMGFNLAKEYGQDTIMGALMSLVGFFLLQVNTDYTLNLDRFGSVGLFTALLVSIFCIEVQKYFVKRNLVIKLPENVPPAIANSFVGLIPLIFIIVVLWIIRVVLNFDITEFINMLFRPIVFALNTLPGILVYVFFICLLWTVGIHGDSVMSAVGMPIFMQYLTENAQAFMAGKPIPYITASGFIDLFINIGGTGATLALVFLMLKSKDEGLRTLGKVALPSGIFEINEPVTFGFPIVFNPLMMIPYILTPLVLTVGTYVLMALNIIGKPVASVPWTMPAIIGPYLITGGDWKAGVWSAIEIIIAAAIYYPFFKATERERLKELEQKK
ncbi:MAG: PTS sugar transporter subunit IIC [Thermovenabulum sp.]|uniref:PTS sugar transporter subunit IIC n=1 Tax=Thermovenabulum sp. TaxID=3100335 RepID=UPI003C7EC286